MSKITEHINCNSCGGTIDNISNGIGKCTYCGNLNKVNGLNTGFIGAPPVPNKPAKPIEFEVENVNGKIIFSPAVLKIDKIIAVIRIRSKKSISDVLAEFECKGYNFPTSYYWSQSSMNLFDMDISTHINDLTDFNFQQLTKGSKIYVILFAAALINSAQIPF